MDMPRQIAVVTIYTMMNQGDRREEIFRSLKGQGQLKGQFSTF